MSSRPNTSTTNQTPAWLLLLAGIWICGFLWVFFGQSLNAPDLHRTDLWLMMILGTDADNSAAWSGTPSGVSFLSQRLPLFARAVFLLILAAAHGDAVCVLLTNRVRILWSERIVFCMGTGLAILSLVTLCCGLAGQLNPTGLVVPSVVSATISIGVRMRNRKLNRNDIPEAATPNGSPVLARLVLLVLIPFAVYLLLGSVSPPTDFDVREYHLQGPKEWFQQGRVTFLRHNVYTSFPFLSEMLCLAGMVISDDWWQGALVGQIVLACFQLLSTLSVFAIARRWISTDAGWLAAMIYLTTPWTLRISLIPYAEGALTFFLIASAMTAMLCIVDTRGNRSLNILCGLLAGSAMASKYTGLVSVILPTAVVLGMSLWMNRKAASANHQLPAPQKSKSRWHSLVVGGCCYGIGVALMVAPWLLRNIYDTGNPVYPLGYTIFGGAEWSAEMNARFKPAHSPSGHSIAEIPRHFLDAAVRNKWTSGLLFALAVPSVLLWRRQRVVLILLGLSAWGLFTWWALTHRIDRFWIPVIPLLSISAASTWTLSRSALWRTFLGTIIGAVTAFNLYFCSLSLVGFHVGLMDLQASRQDQIRSDIRSLNRSLPKDAKVLMVGEAEVFDATFPLVYNTVFDDCLFEEWTTNPADAGLPAEQRRMLPPDQIHAVLRGRGITHVLVHWGEILRYRLPGSYGFTSYVQPSRFDTLLQQNVLSRPGTLLAKSWQDFSEMDRRVVESWDGFEHLLINDETLAVVQLYQVRTAD